MALLQEAEESENIAQSPDVHAVRMYREDVLFDRVRCSLHRCPHCGCQRKGKYYFRRHAVRSRTLSIVVGRLIHKVEASFIRWKCPICGCTFTDYPSFAIPFKHYSLPQMRERARRYVRDNRISYRKGVTTSAMPLYHANGKVMSADAGELEKEGEELSTMAHSTLYRWITTLGRRMSQGNGNTDSTCKPVSRISTRKYRKQARKRVLEACRNL